jgi:uncharacterized protein (DUF169 family)
MRAMTDYDAIEQQFRDSFVLRRRPVAVAFRDAPPPGVDKFTGTEPSGCSFWRIAGEGRTFYTVPSDHFNCAVGSHTHNIPLPPDRADELGQTLGLMQGLGYLRMEEVPGIPRLPATPRVVVYAPLGDTPVDPDVVLVAGRPGPLMRVMETVLRAGLASQIPFMARPTCMALPAALAQGTVASTGCIGNRVYTDLGDDELYVAIPGRDIARLADEARTVAAANVSLAEYHRGRRQALATE